MKEILILMRNTPILSQKENPHPHPDDEYPHGDDEKPQKPMRGTLVSLVDVGHPVHGGCVRVVLDKCIKKDIFSHPI